jgi:ribosomal protein S27AE
MKQLKRCPRCGGNLFLSNESGVPEWACLQCARTYPAVVTREGVAVAAEIGREREPAAAGHRRAA